MTFNYEKLDVTRNIQKLIVSIYEITSTFPSEERFGLVSQIRRASVSVLLNIAEGSSRRSRAEFSRFISIAIGSLVEVDALLKLARVLRYIHDKPAEDYLRQIQEIYFPMVALRKSMKRNQQIEQIESSEHIELVEQPEPVAL